MQIEELEKQIKKKIGWCLSEGWIKPDEIAYYIMPLISDYVGGLIGKDEEKPREKELNGYMKFEIRNQLRAEQRRKAGLSSIEGDK